MGRSPIEYSRVPDKRSEKVKQTEKSFPMKENHQRRQIMALCVCTQILRAGHR